MLSIAGQATHFLDEGRAWPPEQTGQAPRSGRFALGPYKPVQVSWVVRPQSARSEHPQCSRRPEMFPAVEGRGQSASPEPLRAIVEEG
jgi:hypothetical protein